MKPGVRHGDEDGCEFPDTLESVPLEAPGIEADLLVRLAEGRGPEILVLPGPAAGQGDLALVLRKVRAPDREGQAKPTAPLEHVGERPGTSRRGGLRLDRGSAPAHGLDDALGGPAVERREVEGPAEAIRGDRGSRRSGVVEMHGPTGNRA